MSSISARLQRGGKRSAVPKKGLVGISRYFSMRRSRNVIYILALFAALAITIWRAHTLYVERGDLIDAAKAAVVDMAYDTTDSASQAIDNADLLAEDAAIFVRQGGGVAKLEQSELQSYLTRRAVITTAIDSLLVVDKDGNSLAMSEGPKTPKVNISDRRWFKAHAQQGHDTYINPAIRARPTNLIIYTYSKTLKGLDGAFAGVVDVGIGIRNTKKPQERRPGQSIRQLWKDGRLIFSNFMAFDKNGDMLPQSAPFTGPFPDEAGLVKADDPDLIVGYHVEPVRGLVATVTLRRSEVLARWRENVKIGFVVFSLALLVGGLLTKLAADLAETDRRARHAIEDTVDALSAAVAQRDHLLKEIHHRVKNNLQLTSSLIQIQSREFEHGDVRNAFKETQQRLYAIGMIHDVLYHEENSAAIEIHGYLTRLSAEIGRANEAMVRGIRTELDIPLLELMPDQATPLGLITSEILINAYKQTYPPDKGGLIRIALHEQDREVTLTISTNGTGYELQAGTALGGRLVRTLTTQLRGASQFDADAQGAFRLLFRKAEDKRVPSS